MIFLLGAICIGLLWLIWDRATKAEKASHRPISDEIRRSSLPEGRKLELLIDAAKAEGERPAWHERSLSSIGVVVFFSTLSVAAVQAWQADVAKREAQVLQQDQKRLRDEAETQKQLLEIGAEQLLENYDRNLALTDQERELLRKTVDYRRQKKTRTVSDTRFLFRAYTILDDWTSAANLLIGKDKQTLEQINPQDGIQAAARLYILGEAEAALQMVSDIDLQGAAVSSRARMDAWGLLWLLEPDQHENLATSAAFTMKVEKNVAERSLAKRAMDLRQVAQVAQEQAFKPSPAKPPQK